MSVVFFVRVLFRKKVVMGASEMVCGGGDSVNTDIHL